MKKFSKPNLFILLIVIVISLVYLYLTGQIQFPYRLDYSAGNCSTAEDCHWIDKGCGGGHGLCSSKPQEGLSFSPCDVNYDFPANQGYKCTCLVSKGKCGWSLK